MTGKLTDEEASYLRQVASKRWHADLPFRLDRTSLALVQNGLLELDVTHYLAKWYLTPAGEQALRERSPSS